MDRNALGRRATTYAAVAIAGALTWPSLAAGQEPGVHLDPSSPAGNEYAIPLEQARRVGGRPDGSSAASTIGARRSPAPDVFGAGIRRARSAPRRRSSLEAPVRRSASRKDSGTTYAAVVQASDGSSAGLVTGGAAAAALLLGALAWALSRTWARTDRP